LALALAAGGFIAVGGGSVRAGAGAGHRRHDPWRCAALRCYAMRCDAMRDGVQLECVWGDGWSPGRSL
jgi:hypothetical protein